MIEPGAPRAWAIVCLLVPVIVYGVSAIATNLNLGVRHVLPLYPFLFVALGIGVWRMMCRWAPLGGLLALALLLGLVVESAMAWPNYIAFFNTPSGGSRGGVKLLSDSNLDWGQDLPLLRDWQEENPTRKLYLCYFGTADPRFYKLDFTNLPGGWPWMPETVPTQPGGVLAISATNLQGTYFGTQARDFYQSLIAGRDPIQVLGGTIYLYDLKEPPRPQH